MKQISCIAMLTLAGVGQAVTISTYPSTAADANPVYGLFGQSFSAPNSVSTRLTTWRTDLYNDSDANSVEASIYTLSGVQPDQLVASNIQSVGFGPTVEVIFQFDVDLTFGQNYLLVFDNNGNNGAFGTRLSNDLYSGGGYWRDTDGAGPVPPQFPFGGVFDTTFEAQFEAVPEPATITMLGLCGLALLRRKSKRSDV